MDIRHLVVMATYTEVSRLEAHLCESQWFPNFSRIALELQERGSVLGCYTTGRQHLLYLRLLGIIGSNANHDCLLLCMPPEDFPVPLFPVAAKRTPKTSLVMDAPGGNGRSTHRALAQPEAVKLWPSHSRLPKIDLHTYFTQVW